jgi:hypothetical protein
MKQQKALAAILRINSVACCSLEFEDKKNVCVVGER